VVGVGGLHVVDLDTANTRTLAAASKPGRYVEQMVITRRGVYAIWSACSSPYGPGVDYTSWSGSTRRLPGSAEGLLGGAGRVWSYSGDPAVLHRLAPGFRPLALPKRTFPVAVTGDGIIASRFPRNPNSLRAPLVELLDAETGKLSATIARGYPLAAAQGVVLTYASPCGQALRPCTISRTPVDRPGQTQRFPMPRNRFPGGGSAAVSRDGSLLAFQLTRREPDPRYASDDPVPPSDIAVLDLHSGSLQVVPGIELPPKAAAGMVFTANNGLLAIALGWGVGARLLLWHPGRADSPAWPAPREVQTPLPGAYGYLVPLGLAPPP